MHFTKSLLKQPSGRSDELRMPMLSWPLSFSVAFALIGLLMLTSCRDRKAEEANAKLANAKLISSKPLDSDLILDTNTNLSSSYKPNSSTGTGPDQTSKELENIVSLEKQGQYDSALAKATAVIQAEPKNVNAYIVRGHIYSEMKLWDKAGADYQAVLQIDPENFPANFNICEVNLMQKDYDHARVGFVALEGNPDWGDLAAYKVFVCDLFAGHEAVAQSELDAFDKAGGHASYYYSKATWEFYHKHPEPAQTWLDEAAWIYPHKKVYFYSATLVDFGYIKPQPQEGQNQ